MGFLEDVASWFFDSFFGWIGDLVGGIFEQFMALVFQVRTIETEGVFPLGQPVSRLSGDAGAEMILTDGLFLWGASRVYDYVWIGEGGGVAVVAVFLLIAGYGLGGYIDMFKFNPSQSTQSDTSLLRGLLGIAAWYPAYLGFIGLVHGGIIAFTPSETFGGTFLTSGIVTAVGSGLAIGPVGWILLIIAAIPYVLLMIIMTLRNVMMLVYLLCGPVLMAIKHSDLPVASRSADQILKKSIPIVIMPAPMAPIMFLIGNFLVGSENPIGTYAAMFSSTVGIFVFLLLGWVLFLAVYFTFKIVAPAIAGGGSTLAGIAGAGAVVATGGGAAAAGVAARSPGGAAARMAASKIGGNSGDGGSNWDRDGTRDD